MIESHQETFVKGLVLRMKGWLLRIGLKIRIRERKDKKFLTYARTMNEQRLEILLKCMVHT